MKGIIQTMLEEIYTTSTEIARKNQQTVGEKNDYYITLEQLMEIIKGYLD